MTTYGTDFDCVSDIQPTLAQASSEAVALAQAVARRLITPRGSLFYDQEYGYDVRKWIGSSDPPVASIASAVSSEARKDERVADCDARVTFDVDSQTIEIRFRLVPEDPSVTTFDFSVLVGSLTASVLLEGIQT